MKKISMYVVALIGLVAVLGITTMFVGNKPPVHATTNCPMGDTQCLSGWAWSSNTGWISFNSGDSKAGGGPYDVSVNSNGVLNGYAWSPNIGWVSFNSADLNGCNAGAQQVSINQTTGLVTGWARVISEENRSDGWDGCIEMSGINHLSIGQTDPNNSNDKYVTADGTPSGTSTSGLAYGFDSTNLNTYGKITGYAWGGNVMGWLNFSPALTTGPGPTVCVTGTNGCPPGPINPAPSLNFQAQDPLSDWNPNGASISYDPSTGIGNVPVRWDSSNLTSDLSVSGDWPSSYHTGQLVSTTSPQKTLVYYGLSGYPTKNITLTYTYSENMKIQTLQQTLKITFKPNSNPQPLLCSTKPANTIPCGTYLGAPAGPIIDASSSDCSNLKSTPSDPTKLVCEFYCQTGYTKTASGSCSKSSLREN